MDIRLVREMLLHDCFQPGNNAVEEILLTKELLSPVLLRFPGSWSDSRWDRLLIQVGLRTGALLFGPQYQLSLLH